MRNKIKNGETRVRLLDQVGVVGSGLVSADF